MRPNPPHPGRVGVGKTGLTRSTYGSSTSSEGTEDREDLLVDTPGLYPSLGSKTENQKDDKENRLRPRKGTCQIKGTCDTRTKKVLTHCDTSKWSGTTTRATPGVPSLEWTGKRMEEVRNESVVVRKDRVFTRKVLRLDGYRGLLQ